MKKIIMGLFAITLSLFATMILVECALRAVMPLENIPQREYDADLGWKGRANLRCILREQQFSMAITQNSKGFRDRERALVLPSGIQRVLCVGDSFTWGWGVRQECIYSSLLETGLNDGGDSRWDVMNTGVGGYSTDQILLYLRQSGFQYKPQVIIYQVAQNDVTAGNTLQVAEGVYQKPYFTWAPKGQLCLSNCPVEKAAFGTRVGIFLSRHSRFIYFLKHRLHVSWFCRHQKNIEQQASDIPDSSKNTYAFQLFTALCNEMSKECRQNGARLILLIDFPFTEGERAYWASACGSIETYFLVPYFEAKERETGCSARIPEDGHWSEDGHRWVAEFVLTEVLPEKRDD